MVATISGEPATPCVSDVTLGRSASSSPTARIATASSSTPRTRSRVTRASRSLCHDQKTVCRWSHPPLTWRLREAPRRLPGDGRFLDGMPATWGPRNRPGGPRKQARTGIGGAGSGRGDLGPAADGGQGTAFERRGPTRHLPPGIAPIRERGVARGPAWRHLPIRHSTSGIRNSEARIGRRGAFVRAAGESAPTVDRRVSERPVPGGTAGRRGANAGRVGRGAQALNGV